MKNPIPTVQLNLRFPAEEVQRWKTAAFEANLTLTQWIQQQLAAQQRPAAVPPDPVLDPEAARAARRKALQGW